MKNLLLVLVLQCIPLLTIGDESILDEEKAKFVIAEISEASQRLDIEALRKYIDSQSRFIWKTSVEGGKDGKEVSGDKWLKFLEFFGSMSPDSGGDLQSKIESIHIDRGLNQATVIEDVTATYPLAGVTYEEKATETTILGVRNGSIKVVYWERNTTKFTEIE